MRQRRDMRLAIRLGPQQALAFDARTPKWEFISRLRTEGRISASAIKSVRGQFARIAGANRGGAIKLILWVPRTAGKQSHRTGSGDLSIVH